MNIRFSVVALSFLLGISFSASVSAQIPRTLQELLDDTPFVTVFVAGPMEIIDASTFIVRGNTVKLAGLDIPELDARCDDGEDGPDECGVTALAVMLELISDADGLECILEGVGQREELLVSCRSEELELVDNEITTSSLGEHLVLRGVARHDDNSDIVNTGPLRVAEQKAQERLAGFWECRAATPRGWSSDKSRLCR